MGATGATVGDDLGLGSILDNEPDPDVIRLTMGETAVYEGNAGARAAVFSVRLSSPSVKPVTVDYTTVAGTAKATKDYTTRSGTVTFAPGTTTQSIKVPITPDSKVEPDETFTVRLSRVTGGAIQRTLAAIGTILGDEVMAAPCGGKDRPTCQLGGSGVPTLQRAGVVHGH